MQHIGFYLRDIHFNKKSGRLVFKEKSIQKYLFFQNGTLIFTKSTHRQELLGEILFKLRKISKETYLKIDQYIEPMRSIGEVLVENDLLTEKNLHDGLMYQMREITLNIFPYFNGKFDFQEKKGSTRRKLESKMNVPDLIEEGIRRMEYNAKLKKFIENKIPFPEKKDFLDRLTIKEKELLDKIDGSSSAEALLQSTSSSPKFFWRSLYLFYCLNLIDVKDKGKVKISEKKGKVTPVAKKRVKKVAPAAKKKAKEVSIGDKEKVKKTVDDDSEKRIAEVVELKEYLSTKDYYQILNVSQSASQDEIKTAYFNLARKYHPDHFDRDLSSDIKEKIEEVFGHITKAYQTLSTEEKRKEYDSKKDVPLEPDKANLEKKAEIKFRHGKTLYYQEKYEDALIFLEEAVRLKKNKGSYFLWLAMTESRIPSFHRKAEDDFFKAIELEPWSPDGYVGLGAFYKQEGLLVKAKKQFKKALEIDSENKVALKELGISGKSDKKKGLTGIFSFEGFRKGKKKKKS